MKFTLTFDGELPASGNKAKPEAKWAIRNQIHPQLAELWQTQPMLKALRANAVVPTGNQWVSQKFQYDTDRFGGLPSGSPMTDTQIDTCAPMVFGDKAYTPLIRSSLHLSCELEILFLRKEEPGATLLQAGELDNRLKTLFDGLRLPEPDELKAGSPVESPLCCLMESDTLIDAVHVRTGQLLTRPGGSIREVRAVIEVKVKVLKFRPYNAMLLGD